MEIIKDLNPGFRKYRFTHYNCCEFTAFENKFRWIFEQHRETTASVICPKCKEQFYDDPKLIGYK